MANVLGTLFGNIANAIREKTGETGTMKPSEFAGKIESIVIGGGSGGTLVGSYGTFTASATSQTIRHNLGTVPLAVLIHSTYGTLISGEGGMIMSVGFSEEASKLMGRPNGLTYYMRIMDVLSSGYQAEVSQSSSGKYIETTTYKQTINKATETTVTFGEDSQAHLKSGVDYTWYAIGIKRDDE